MQKLILFTLLFGEKAFAQNDTNTTTTTTAASTTTTTTAASTTTTTAAASTTTTTAAAAAVTTTTTAAAGATATSPAPAGTAQTVTARLGLTINAPTGADLSTNNAALVTSLKTAIGGALNVPFSVQLTINTITTGRILRELAAQLRALTAQTLNVDFSLTVTGTTNSAAVATKLNAVAGTAGAFVDQIVTNFNNAAPTNYTASGTPSVSNVVDPGVPTTAGAVTTALSGAVVLALGAMFA